MTSLACCDDALFLARALAILHALVVGVIVAGTVAVVFGRFRHFRRDDLFAWAFFACCLGQLLSLALTGGCIFTNWQKELLLQSGETEPFSGTFLQRYLPFLPDWFAHRGVPLLTLAALIGAGVQVAAALRGHQRRKAP